MDRRSGLCVVRAPVQYSSTGLLFLLLAQGPNHTKLCMKTTVLSANASRASACDEIHDDTTIPGSITHVPTAHHPRGTTVLQYVELYRYGV